MTGPAAAIAESGSGVRLSIVATVYHSESYLEEFYQRCTQAARTYTEAYEIVIVNDGSPDRCLDLAIALYERDPHVRIVDLARNFGHHAAMLTGLGYARGDLVFLLDADLEEDPGLLPQFLARMREAGCDVVYGIQTARKGGTFERVSGAAYYTGMNMLLNEPIPVSATTMRLMSRRYVRSLVEHKDREIFLSGLQLITGYEKVPLAIEKRDKGSSTYTLGRKLSLVVRGVTSFSSKPLVAMFSAGMVFLVGSLVAAAYLVLRRILGGDYLIGWPSLIVSIWLLGGLILFCLGLVGIYLSKVFVETKSRPYVVVRRIYDADADAH